MTLSDFVNEKKIRYWLTIDTVNVNGDIYDRQAQIEECVLYEITIAIVSHSTLHRRLMRTVADEKFAARHANDYTSGAEPAYWSAGAGCGSRGGFGSLPEAVVSVSLHTILLKLHWRALKLDNYLKFVFK